MKEVIKKWLCRKPVFGLLGIGSSVFFGWLQLPTVAVVAPLVLPVLFMVSETILDNHSISVKKGDISVEIGTGKETGV
ncbi:MAG: hypothetical protein IJL80_16105 [Treponema sp.]|nr:hypothetical protein [Treponema sp.]